MTLNSGSRLGPYEIVSPIGAGGMGEVYRAKDTRLEREVAVKVLPKHLSSSEEMRQRFEREAKAISQLSHPHICALYDVGSHEGIEYLVMELLEGETLAARLAKGALPLEQTLRFGVEIAEALDKAHRQGIVHRDLKPGNVMLTKAGVKLLDFGLAKVMSPAQKQSDVTSLPTVAGAANLTEQGTILGTFQYMAPEQLEGQEADARTDIFAFGCVLYEMATGNKAFSGTSRASLITAIMSADPPPVSSVQRMSPAAFDRVVKTCLAKDPEDRWQSAADVAKELKWVAEGSQAGVAAPATFAGRRKWRERLAWTVAALALIFGIVAAFRPGQAKSPGELVRFAMTAPPGQSFASTVGLAPDGKRLLLLLWDENGRTSIWVRPLDSLEARRVPGTEGARGPFWSPDGREIAFFLDGKLKRIGADGGPLQTICDAGSGFSGSWSPNGTIAFTMEFGAGIVAVPAAGGTPNPVTALDEKRGEVGHFYPDFLPDGRHFVFVARALDPEKTSIMVGSLDGKEVLPLMHADSAAIYADPGYLLFARDNALVAWRFDPDRLRLVGDPRPVFESIQYGTEDNSLSASAAGNRVAYMSWSLRRSLVWMDRKGRELGTLGEVADYEDVRISPDGRRVAAALRDPARGQNLDLWVLDAARGTAARVTSERTDEFNPAWFPDGERLAYVSDHVGFYDLYERSVSGGVEKLLARTKQDKILPTVSSDGGRLLYSLSEGPRFSSVLQELSGPGASRRLNASLSSEEHPEMAPGGDWNAFESSESGRREVYVQPVSGGPKRQVSVGGGQTPIWRKDGAELFYCAKDALLMSVSVRSTGGHLELGEPQPLFPLQLGTQGGGSVQLFRRPYDVAPGGERFLVIRRAPGVAPDDAVVVMNWTAALKGAR
jgi:Tol biopolymer transport system component